MQARIHTRPSRFPGISQLLIFPMSITEGHKIQLMCGMAGVCVSGGSGVGMNATLD